jgi:hypothetical protein
MQQVVCHRPGAPEAEPEPCSGPARDAEWHLSGAWNLVACIADLLFRDRGMPSVRARRVFANAWKAQVPARGLALNARDTTPGRLGSWQTLPEKLIRSCTDPATRPVPCARRYARPNCDFIRDSTCAADTAWTGQLSCCLMVAHRMKDDDPIRVAAIEEVERPHGFPGTLHRGATHCLGHGESRVADVANGAAAARHVAANRPRNPARTSSEWPHSPSWPSVWRSASALASGCVLVMV